MATFCRFALQPTVQAEDPKERGPDLQRPRDARPGEQPRRQQPERHAHGDGLRPVWPSSTISTLSNSGSGYTLPASSTGLTAGTSLPFNVSNDQLVVTTQPPDSTTAGTPLGLVVTAENVNGQVDTSFNGNVTVALGNMSGGPDNILAGTLTVTAVNGVATFSGLTVNQVGQNGYYDLEVSSNGLTDTYTTFYVTAAPATQLVVTAQPASITAGAGFEVDVAAEDANGNVDPSYNGSVTLALETNPAGGTLGGDSHGDGLRRRRHFPRPDDRQCGQRLHDPGDRQRPDLGDDERHRRNGPRGRQPTGTDFRAAGQRHRRHRLRPGRIGRG